MAGCERVSFAAQMHDGRQPLCTGRRLVRRAEAAVRRASAAALTLLRIVLFLKIAGVL
jgi:hypothetical protein